MPSDEVDEFVQSIVNVFRLNAFKGEPESKVRKIKKPTPKNANSRKNLRAKERVKYIKQKKIKSREEKAARKKEAEYFVTLAKGTKPAA